MKKNNNKCFAIRKDNIRCIISKTYEINYKNDKVYLCGIHLNVFKRNNLRLFDEPNKNTQKGNILNLPIEILEIIFSNIKIKNLFYLKLICKRWSIIIEEYIRNSFLCTLILDKILKIRFSKYYDHNLYYENSNIKYITFFIDQYKISSKYKIQNLEVTCFYLSDNLINIIQYAYYNFDIKNIYLNFLNTNKRLFTDILITILNNTKNSIEIHTYEEIKLEKKINVKNYQLKRLLIYNNDIYKNINIYFPNLNILALFPQLIYMVKNYYFKKIKILEVVDNFDKYKVNGINEDLFNSITYFLENNNIKLIKWNIVIEKYIAKLNKLPNIYYILISKKYNKKYLKKYKNVKFT